MRAALACALVALAAAIAAGGAGGAIGRECTGISTCIDVPGPWVAVPATGEATFLLECPNRQGLVAGVDARASSRDVHVTFDGLLGSPVSPGRTTTAYAFFRAVSAHHEAGFFQPLLGCVPSNPSGAQTTAYLITPVGPALDLVATALQLAPGADRDAVLRCAHGESLAYSWDATAFATSTPPPAALTSAVSVRRTQRGGVVRFTAQASEALPRTARAEVQIGLACSK